MRSPAEGEAGKLKSWWMDKGEGRMKCSDTAALALPLPISRAETTPCDTVTAVLWARQPGPAPPTALSPQLQVPEDRGDAHPRTLPISSALDPGSQHQGAHQASG